MGRGKPDKSFHKGQKMIIHQNPLTGDWRDENGRKSHGCMLQRVVLVWEIVEIRTAHVFPF